MASVWSNQPFKAAYMAFLIMKILTMLPWLLARYSLAAFRPLPEWSLKACIFSEVWRQVFRYHAKTRYSGLAGVISDHQKAKERHSLARPAEAKYYSGALKPGAAKPMAVGGLWYPAPLFEGSPNLEDEKVVLYLPGGAFVIAFGQETRGQLVSGIMSQYLKATRTFYAQYRVSSDANTRFPAALQDMVTCYHYILSLGIRPQNVILSGDSAAGNLVIGFLRYLEATSELPLPGAAIVWSPWVDVTPQAANSYETNRNASTDFLINSILEWGVDAYFPQKQPNADQMAYISPLHHPFRTKVPLFINAGSAEGLFDTIKEFADQMAAVQGNKVKFHATELSPHDLIMAYEGFGLERQVEIAATDAYNFFRQAT